MGRGKRQRTPSSNYVRERDSLRTDNFAYIIQVYIMPNTSSHGIMNQLHDSLVFFFFFNLFAFISFHSLNSLKMANIGELP